MGDTPPVPYTVETLDQLRARYPKALETVFDVDEIIAGGIRPGLCPANVFDFDDGLRLLVSRERHPDNKIVLHVSASFRDECRIADEFRLLMLTQDILDIQRLADKWAASIPDRFAELAQDSGPPLELLGWSENKIPHFLREERHE